MTFGSAAIAQPALHPPTAPASGDAEFLTIGIDVGGTKIACVVTDARDQVLHHHVEPTDRNRLTEQIGELAARAGRAVAESNGSRVAAIGVAIPGQVEPRHGRAELAVNLGAPDMELGPTVSSATGLPCFVEHDARAAAMWVHGRGSGDLCYLSVGTGIAAGIVLDGRPLAGETGLAGEVGHSVVDPNGLPCPCGSIGCLETVAAGPAIARKAREAAAASTPTTTLTTRASAEDVFRAAAAHDAVAKQIVNEVAMHLARALRSLILTLGVQRIVIGGGVAAAGDALLNPILAALQKERDRSPLVEAVFASTSIELLPPDLEPGARGAALAARQRIGAAHREEVAER